MCKLSSEYMVSYPLECGEPAYDDSAVSLFKVFGFFTFPSV